MDFIDEVRQFSSRVQNLLVHIKSEEATKHSLVLPFLQLLGYNVFDPAEVVPEFTADIGTKKGEKVDYAIVIGGKPAILVEAKPVTDDLTGHDSQLFRYFTATEAKFAIMTNGIIYKFYSDLQEPNKMDEEPFLEFNLLDPNEAIVAEVKRFHKENFNADDLFSTASNLKYTTKIKALMDSQFKDPSESFLRFVLKEVYHGKITHNVLERFGPIVKKALNQYIGELISEKLKSAIKTTMEAEKESPPAAQEVATASETSEAEEGSSRVQTTTAELEGFFLVKAIVREVIAPERVTFKDTASYFAILVDGNVRKWICRLYFNRAQKYVSIQSKDKTASPLIPIEKIDDLFNYRDQLVAIAAALADTGQGE
ncbi:MAG: type I restriction enzyme HsdR N-terminal domain-containing protein [Limnochordales bacterium]|nr:type I restriction enzyme HsdR N-terminal domain-containing protein [Limnochordales bacterium]